MGKASVQLFDPEYVTLGNGNSALVGIVPVNATYKKPLCAKVILKHFKKYVKKLKTKNHKENNTQAEQMFTF